MRKQMRTIILVSLLGAAGCGVADNPGTTPPGIDLTMGGDDLAAPDLAQGAEDLAKREDLVTVSDLTVPPDMAMHVPRWTVVPNDRLNGIWGSSATDVYVVGVSAFHSGDLGATWTAVMTGPDRGFA